MSRKAKIVATLGPSSRDENTIRLLIESGVDVVRLNFSHGTHAGHAETIGLVRKLSRKLHRPIAILQDLQGPKLRVGDLPNDGIKLVAGQKIILTPIEADAQSSSAGETIIPLDVPALAESVQPGNRILMDDGHLEVEVTGVEGVSVHAKVVLGGLLSSHKGVNLPGTHLNIPGFTEKDEEDLAFGLEQDVDMVAISFVRTPEDIQHVRETITKLSPEQASLPIIAKLELPEAIENLHAIIHAADGVMVARGDLGVETSPAAVPIIQKEIIKMANRHAKLVITATQMLDSMIHNPRPTRAEASDVANAALDGTDAVMLSGETASGDYPVESVQMMDAIVCNAEASFSTWGHASEFPQSVTRDDAISMTLAARELAHDRNVACIAVFTVTGKTALLMSKARPQVPILAFTPDQRTYQRMSLYWGVLPFLVPHATTVESMLTIVEQAILSFTEIQPGAQAVVIASFPVGTIQPPNLALLHTIRSGH
jgi:pyruvate kinase